jgi:chromosome segregation protein
MIEEMLGLREYQIKKADAERRLKNSKINLDKATALIEEIVPHLRSLKRQTGRWERRGALEEELRTLEQQFFGWQLHELHEKSAEIDARIATHQKQFEALAKEKNAAAVRQTAVEESQPEERKRLAGVKAEIAALMETRNALQKDLGRIEAQVEMAKRPVAIAASGNHSAEHLLDIIRKVKIELESVLDEEPLAVLAAIESALEELNFVLEEEAGGGAEEKAEVQAPVIPEPLLRDLQRASHDIADLEKNIATLREQERAFEAGQEDFYATFKGAVGDVQAAQAKIDLWEKGNRDLLLEKERIELRHDDVLHQIDQAGRHAEDFRESAGEASASASISAAADFTEMERRMFRLRGDLASIGEVDQALMQEADETEKRHDFLLKESNDLIKAIDDLSTLMQELTEKITGEFDKSLSKINDEFEKFFGLMFDGGTARLKVLQPKVAKAEGEEGSENEEGVSAESSSEEESLFQQHPGGIEIEIKLPRKKTTSLDMLSGGERSLVGIAALFAMVSVSPPPFLVLDEIDAPLDERNARRFGTMLKDFSKHTQFIVVTHNRATMEAADILYGVTLAEDGSSKVISLKLEPKEEAASLPS